MASLDQFGYMRIQDRSKDVVKSGGEWISSIALENAAMGHPKVQGMVSLCGTTWAAWIGSSMLTAAALMRVLLASPYAEL